LGLTKLHNWWGLDGKEPLNWILEWSPTKIQFTALTMGKRDGRKIPLPRLQCSHTFICHTERKPISVERDFTNAQINATSNDITGNPGLSICLGTLAPFAHPLAIISIRVYSIANTFFTCERT
jgi:hypothetical protein